ncbi:MAG: RNA-guided endonuclease InsQ/TnpB family protein [Promethearchaeota archaeon]
MRRTLKLKFRVTESQAKILEKMAFVCTKLWNTANWERRDQWNKTGVIPNYAAQCTNLKENHWYKLLHSQSAQGVLKKLDEAYKAWYALHRKEKKEGKDKKSRPPGFRKKEMLSPILFKQAGFRVEGNRVRLSLAKKLRCELDIPYQFLWLPFQTYRAPTGQPCTLEIKKVDGSWYGYLVELHEAPPMAVSPSPKALAIDQGVINLAAGITTEGDTFLYTGKGLLSIQRYYNKQIATVQHRVQNRAGQSAWTEGLTALYQKRKAQPNHALHALTKQVIKDCLEAEIQLIILGKLKHIRNKKDYGAKANQKLHAWAFHQFATLLRYKAEAVGIRVEEVSEWNTSKTCSTCGKQGRRSTKKGERGVFSCLNKKCSEYGKRRNSDLNGARNILNKYLRGVSRDSEVLVGPLAAPRVSYWNWHVWSHQKWSDRQSGNRAKPLVSDSKPVTPLVESPLLYSTSSSPPLPAKSWLSN